MTVVTENKDSATKVKFNKELESIRPFHAGPLRRCSQCGRLVFHPCHACETARKNRIRDPFDTADVDDWDELRIELQGRERQRYERVHLQKVMDELAQERNL